MREVVIRPRAIEDLEDIWQYTHERWGAGQADRYLFTIDAALTNLAQDPTTGRSMDSVRAGYWSLHVGRHLVFYTFDDDVLSVRRVLHDRMDVPGRLTDD